MRQVGLMLYQLRPRIQMKIKIIHNYDSDNDSEFLADDIGNDCDSDEDMETR